MEERCSALNLTKESLMETAPTTTESSQQLNIWSLQNVKQLSMKWKLVLPIMIFTTCISTPLSTQTLLVPLNLGESRSGDNHTENKEKEKHVPLVKRRRMASSESSSFNPGWTELMSEMLCMFLISFSHGKIAWVVNSGIILSNKKDLFTPGKRLEKTVPSRCWNSQEIKMEL